MALMFAIGEESSGLKRSLASRAMRTARSPSAGWPRFTMIRAQVMVADGVDGAAHILHRAEGGDGLARHRLGQGFLAVDTYEMLGELALLARHRTRVVRLLGVAQGALCVLERALRQPHLPRRARKVPVRLRA
jgi:hypothetical protein